MDATTLIEICGFLIVLFGAVFSIHRAHSTDLRAVEKEAEDARNRLHNRVDELTQKHENERVYVAEHYIKKEELAKLEIKIDKIQELLSNR